MNKETRQFIWGILLILFFGFVLAINYHNYVNDIIFSIWDYLLIPLYLYQMFVGGTYIHKSIK